MFGCSWDLLTSSRASCYWDGPLRCCAPTVLTCSLLPTSQCYHCLCPHYYRQIYPRHHSITAVTSGFDYARMILGITRCLTATGLIHVTGVTSETETFSHEAEASIKMCSIETETLEISTWARHYCASRWSRDQGVKTEATSLLNCRNLSPAVASLTKKSPFSLSNVYL